MAVELAVRIQDRKQQVFTLAGILAFTDKVIDRETAGKIRYIRRKTGSAGTERERKTRSPDSERERKTENGRIREKDRYPHDKEKLFFRRNCFYRNQLLSGPCRGAAEGNSRRKTVARIIAIGEQNFSEII